MPHASHNILLGVVVGLPDDLNAKVRGLEIDNDELELELEELELLILAMSLFSVGNLMVGVFVYEKHRRSQKYGDLTQILPRGRLEFLQQPWRTLGHTTI